MATSVKGNVIALVAANDSTTDVFPSGVKVAAVKLMSGITGGTATVSANGDVIVSGIAVGANTQTDIGPQSAPVWYDSITLTALTGSNVECHVHIV